MRCFGPRVETRGASLPKIASHACDGDLCDPKKFPTREWNENIYILWVIVIRFSTSIDALQSIVDGRAGISRRLVLLNWMPVTRTSPCLIPRLDFGCYWVNATSECLSVWAMIELHFLTVLVFFSQAHLTHVKWLETLALFVCKVERAGNCLCLSVNSTTNIYRVPFDWLQPRLRPRLMRRSSRSWTLMRT